MQKPQNEFPLLDRYKEKFPVDFNTIFAYDGNIYTNHKLTPDLLVHENVHLEQQKEMGADNWVELFLEDSKFRLDQELEAYRKQLASIIDSGKRHKMTLICAENLSSGLYGEIISLSEAFDLLVKNG